MPTLLPPMGSVGISGVVVGDDGLPVVGTVSALPMQAPIVRSRVNSNIDGSFSLMGLTDGSYQLCFLDKAGLYLDPCAWSATLPILTISGKSVSGQKLIVTKAAPIQIRIDDAQSLLTKAPVSGSPTPLLVVGVATPRHTFQLARLTSKGATGRNHLVMVPPNLEVNLKVFGNGLTVTDVKGAVLDIQKSVALPVTSGAISDLTPSLVRLIVTAQQ